jgi:hypothetical protein
MIPVIYSWARSGATVLNKCLVAMGHMVLSELHPTVNSGVHAPRWQANNWHDMDIKTGTPWSDCIAQIEGECNTRKQSLVIRDWTVLSFYPMEENNHAPRKQLIAHRVASKECRPVAFVRSAVDCALSFARFHGWKSVGLINSYAYAYSRYVSQLLDLKIPILRYEVFCRGPQPFLKSLCALLEIPYSDKWREFPRVTKVLGDTYAHRSRGAGATKIRVMPRRLDGSRLTSRIVKDPYLRMADERLAKARA